MTNALRAHPAPPVEAPALPGSRSALPLHRMALRALTVGRAADLERTWALEDERAEIAAKVREDLAEQDAYERARAEIRAEQNVAFGAEYRPQRAD